MTYSRNRILSAALPLLIASTLLGACAASDQTESTTMGAPMVDAAMPAMPEMGEMPGMEDRVSGPGTAAEKSIITSGTMTVEVAEVVTATSDLRQIVAEAQGQIDQAAAD